MPVSGTRHVERQIGRESVLKKTGIIILIVIVAAALVIAGLAMAKSGGKLSVESVKALFTSEKQVERTDEFFFDSDSKAVFADLDGSFLTCSVSALELFAPDGTAVYKENVLLGSPAVSATGGYAAAYDLGGTYFALIGRDGRKWADTASGSIISATVSEQGHLLLCTTESGYKGSVTVYNEEGTALYRWHSGSGYVLKAVMTGDESFAVLGLTEKGSAVTMLELTSEKDKGSVQIEGDMVIDVLPMGKDTFLAVSDTALYKLTLADGSAEKVYDFSSFYLAGYDASADGAVLYVNYYGVGSQGRLITFDGELHQLAEMETEEEILSLAGGDGVYLLLDGGLDQYDMQLTLKAQYPDASGAFTVLRRSDGSAAAVFGHSAKVFG